MNPPLSALFERSPHSPTCFRLSGDGGLALDMELQSVRSNAKDVQDERDVDSLAPINLYSYFSTSKYKFSIILVFLLVPLKMSYEAVRQRGPGKRCGRREVKGVRLDK